jgi:hypothetical protein
MKRTNNSRITYTSLPDVTPESELQTLAAVYTFILGCHARRIATEGSNGKGETELRLHKERGSPCEVDD